MPKDDWVYVGHMLDMTQKALEISAGKDRAAYDDDETLRLALTHIIQIIGEAAQRVSPEFRLSYPKVPWQEIIGMRHRIVHDYLNIDEDVIWEVLKQDLPSLAKTLQSILPPEYI
jgi:uncharacterized protein with HEPN domain